MTENAAEQTTSHSDAELAKLLNSAVTIAVVGTSTNPEKAAHKVPAILVDAGYTVIPVHPTATEILGRRAYPRLADIPGHVDIVDVFRPATEAPGIAEQAVAIGAGALWLQLGVTSTEAGRIAERAGLAFVQDTCIGETTRRLGTTPPSS
jgi:predicted CoA-binding protein